MIDYNRFVLGNGLRVIVHEDDSTPMAVVNVLYDVGARDEDPEHTGFAHLFEHLMFGGSIHIPDFDEPLQRAGGENNAYTTNDLTNYYEQLPAQNLETAFWLESDRMLSLAFSPKSLEVQRKVVSEEFKESYLNKPYGDVWKLIREQAYTMHPYKWMTIGKELSHIEKATLEDVRQFFFAHYLPSNAILVVAGNVKTAEVKKLAEKWFGPIAAGHKAIRHIPREPIQQTPHRMAVHENVPVDAIYKSWHICDRLSPDYYPTDLITDILSGGASSRLFEHLVKEQQLFSNISCYHLGSIDSGLLTIEGKLVKGVDMNRAEAAIDAEVQALTQEPVSQEELEKVINKTESIMAFEDLSIMNRASSLAFYELLGNIDLINTELKLYQKVTQDDILHTSRKIFQTNNSNTLQYFAQPQ